MFRNILAWIVLIVWGILASYWLVIKKAPDLKKEYDKIIPYQWAVWVILLLMWLRDLFHIFTILSTFKVSLFGWLLGLATLFTKLVLWFVLSFWLVTKYILTTDKKKWKKKSKKADADRKEKTNNIYKTLTAIQVPFGILAIILWLLAIILTIYFAIRY